MKKWFLSSLLAAGLVCGFAANAMAEVVIGVVDLMSALEQTESNGVLKKLKGETDSRQSKLKASEKKIMELQQEIKENQSVWSEDKAKEKYVEYQTKVAELQRDLQKYEQEMVELQKKMMGEFQTKAFKIAGDIAKERKIDLILDRGAGVVYFEPKYDLTAEVVKRYKAGK